MEQRWRRTLLYFLLGVGILIALTSFVGWEEIAAALWQAKPVFVVLGFVAGTMQIVMFAFNWYIVLNGIGYDIGLIKTIKVFYAGDFANGITPLGQMGGEPIMAYILSKNSSISYEKSFAGIFSADLINSVPFFTYSVIGVTYFILFQSTGIVVRLLAVTVLLAALFILGFGVLFWYRGEVALRLLLAARAGFGRVSRFIGFDDGLFDDLSADEIRSRYQNFRGTVREVFARRWMLVESLIVTHAAGLLGFVGLYAFLLAVGWKAPFFIIMLITPMSVIAFYMPLPGGLGGVELILVSLLILLAGVPSGMASAAVILFRGAVYAVPLVLGALSLWRISTSWEDVKQAVEEEERDIPG
ncbi:MAG: lysylphosphatidylglycerol synthase transmembrane domain-containing protein [Candidatus Nanohaloarchaea archaeon]|nr:lysylphosphatidylglycerol synthase transmembrane domain-containing protein [Candidatus Nanohaloarchaea archaeon]